MDKMCIKNVQWASNEQVYTLKNVWINNQVTATTKMTTVSFV